MTEDGGRAAELARRASVAFEALRAVADTLTTLGIKRAGFGPADDELDAILYFWWTGSCGEDLGTAASAVAMLEDFAAMGREEEGDPEEEQVWEVFSGVVELLARAARAGGYA